MKGWCCRGSTLIESDVLLLRLEKNGKQGKSLSQCSLGSVWIWNRNDFLTSDAGWKSSLPPTLSEDKDSGCPDVVCKKLYRAGLIFRGNR